jgi:thiamine biosynthesis lipoprotein
LAEKWLLPCPDAMARQERCPCVKCVKCGKCGKCGKSEWTNLNTVTGEYFDTLNSISADAPTGVLESALRLCERYERQFSRFIEGSDVWRLNHACGEPVGLDWETVTVLRCAEELRAASGGAFNVAVGAASSLWRFGDAQPTLPDADKLACAVDRLAAFHIGLVEETAMIPAGCSIDLGGIAKGYICGQVADFLRGAGVASALLNFGGNVVTVGQHPEGRPWGIGLQKPGAKRESEIFASVDSVDEAVVTSGVYERCFELDGRLYHHVLDPRDCRPARSGIACATVISKDAMLADALATALMVLDPHEGLSLAQRYDAKAVILKDDGSLTQSPGLSIRLTDGATPTVSCPLVSQTDGQGS